jgi:hypothetical protein
MTLSVKNRTGQILRASVRCPDPPRLQTEVSESGICPNGTSSVLGVIDHPRASCQVGCSQVGWNKEAPVLERNCFESVMSLLRDAVGVSHDDVTTGPPAGEV